MTETLIYRIDQLYSYWLVTVLRKPIRVDIPVWKDSFRFGRPIAIQETSACDGDVERSKESVLGCRIGSTLPTSNVRIDLLSIGCMIRHRRSMPRSNRESHEIAI